jgi:hypothetical protein
MVRPLFGWRLALSRSGVSWNTRGLARTTRVRHPVPDFAAPAAKVFRIGADPGASIDNHRNGRQAEPRHSAWAPVSAPGSALGLLLGRALSSAEAVLQSEAGVLCLSRNLLHRATGQKPDRHASPAIGDRAPRPA